MNKEIKEITECLELLRHAQRWLCGDAAPGLLSDIISSAVYQIESGLGEYEYDHQLEDGCRGGLVFFPDQKGKEFDSEWWEEFMKTCQSREQPTMFVWADWDGYIDGNQYSNHDAFASLCCTKDHLLAGGTTCGGHEYKIKINAIRQRQNEGNTRCYTFDVIESSYTVSGPHCTLPVICNAYLEIDGDFTGSTFWPDWLEEIVERRSEFGFWGAKHGYYPAKVDPDKLTGLSLKGRNIKIRTARGLLVTASGAYKGYKIGERSPYTDLHFRDDGKLKVLEYPTFLWRLLMLYLHLPEDATPNYRRYQDDTRLGCLIGRIIARGDLVDPTNPPKKVPLMDPSQDTVTAFESDNSVRQKHRQTTVKPTEYTALNVFISHYWASNVDTQKRMDGELLVLAEQGSLPAINALIAIEATAFDD